MAVTAVETLVMGGGNREAGAGKRGSGGCWLWQRWMWWRQWQRWQYNCRCGGSNNKGMALADNSGNSTGRRQGQKQIQWREQKTINQAAAIVVTMAVVVA